MEVTLIEWNLDLKSPARLVKTYRVLSTNASMLPRFICTDDMIFGRLLDSKFYARI